MESNKILRQGGAVPAKNEKQVIKPNYTADQVYRAILGLTDARMMRKPVQDAASVVWRKYFEGDDSNWQALNDSQKEKASLELYENLCKDKEVLEIIPVPGDFPGLAMWLLKQRHKNRSERRKKKKFRPKPQSTNEQHSGDQASNERHDADSANDQHHVSERHNTDTGE